MTKRGDGCFTWGGPNAPNAARHSTCQNGQNTSTKTQCGISGNARRALMPLRPPSHMKRWRHKRCRTVHSDRLPHPLWMRIFQTGAYQKGGLGCEVGRVFANPSSAQHVVWQGTCSRRRPPCLGSSGRRSGGGLRHSARLWVSARFDSERFCWAAIITRWQAAWPSGPSAVTAYLRSHRPKDQSRMSAG
jgi:hypothetical protein